MTPQQVLLALAQGKTLRLYISANEGYVTLTYHDALAHLIRNREDLLSLKPDKAHQPYIITISGLAGSGKTRALLSMAGSYDEIFSVKGVLAYLKIGHSQLDTLYVDEVNKEDLEKIKLASIGSNVKRIYVAGENL